MLVVDIEASGLSPEKCSILSIGALDLENPERRFYGACRVWEGAHISEDALEVNGFTEAEAMDSSKKSEAELVREFLEWSQHLNNRTLAGQNPSFDRDFLEAAALRAGLSWDLAHRTIDSHTLAYMHIVKSGKDAPIDPQHRRSSLNLDTILNYCGIPEEPKPHNALTGAMSHAEVISRLLYDKKLLPEFDAYKIPWTV
ncbi:MAG: 3'-5' exonuclease [Candidatus Paceibacterota bacterium]